MTSTGAHAGDSLAPYTSPLLSGERYRQTVSGYVACVGRDVAYLSPDTVKAHQAPRLPSACLIGRDGCTRCPSDWERP